MQLNDQQRNPDTYAIVGSSILAHVALFLVGGNVLQQQSWVSSHLLLCWNLSESLLYYTCNVVHFIRVKHSCGCSLFQVQSHFEGVSQ